MEKQLFFKYLLILGFAFMISIMFLGYFYMPKSQVYAGYTLKQQQREERISVLRQEITDSIVEDQMRMRIRNSFDTQRFSFVDPKERAAKLDYILEESQKNGKKLIRQKELYGVTELEKPDSVAKAESLRSVYSEKVGVLSESLKSIAKGSKAKEKNQTDAAE